MLERLKKIFNRDVIIMDEDMKQKHLKMMKEHVRHSLDAPKEVPFGYDGILFYVTSFKGSMYELKWYDDKGARFVENFESIDDIFVFVENEDYKKFNMQKHVGNN